MTDDAFTAGHVVGGRYRLVRRLGEGGMGAVWLADHVTLKSQVALKLLHGEVQESDDGIKRFLREAQAAAQLRSPHVVQILEHGVDGNVPFIAMELLDGESLATRLARLSTLSLAQTARVVTHVARAIGKAHDAGIVHRDLKPDNIFIVHNDDEEIVKVLDFGIAKMDPVTAEAAAKISTQAGALLGTPQYMSPEQVRGLGVDLRSDLWSLGVIAFECVCGRLPFDGRTVGSILVHICSDPAPVPSTLRPLPAAFDEWFAKATMRDPDKRFQSAKEMADALRALVGEESRTPLPRDTGDSGQHVSHDAKTLDAKDSLRDLERARTVSVGGTMGGSSTAVQAQAGKRSLRFVGGALALVTVGVVAWFAIGPTRSAAVVTPEVKPTATAAISTSVAVASAAPTSPPSAASASAAPSATASTTTTTSARPHAHHVDPARSTSSATPSDELTF
jgi:eukaryotic-like serine/threonine-protein kinase